MNLKQMWNAAVAKDEFKNMICSIHAGLLQSSSRKFLYLIEKLYSIFVFNFSTEILPVNSRIAVVYDALSMMIENVLSLLHLFGFLLDTVKSHLSDEK